MKNIEQRTVSAEEAALPEIPKVHPEAREILEAADVLLRSQTLTKGMYGVILTEPGTVTVGIHVTSSRMFPDHMYDIDVNIIPHDEEITPEMYGGTQIAINEGAVPSKNDKWGMTHLSNNNQPGFSFVPGSAVSKLRLIFPEEREQLRRERMEKNRIGA